ncbi:MAG TPA: hypothetical protein DCG38_04810 [Eubacteriaceae bacterium]|nr:hypothetical protein [Eubacteriaceae bacterium]
MMKMHIYTFYSTYSAAKEKIKEKYFPEDNRELNRWQFSAHQKFSEIGFRISMTSRKPKINY